MNDNVKKVFEMLGVEPFERFMLDTRIYALKNKKVWFDENLDLYGEDECYSEYLPNLIRGLPIIKLPNCKRKKLRDLTKEEYRKWRINNACLANLGFDCSKYSNCIFKSVICGVSVENSWINNKDLYSDKFLDQEIEVE